MKGEAAFRISSGGGKLALVAAAVILLLISYFPLKWGFASTAATRVDTIDVARFLAAMASNDPQTHFAYAVLLEKSFIPSDLDLAAGEYEKSVSLSPYNYLLWLQLGRAREKVGDTAGAEAALRRALELAPNYSQVQWALGNLLVRQGRTEEGFAEIRNAIESDSGLASAAVNTGWLLLDRDLPALRRELGDSTAVDLALVGLLAREKRVDDAVSVWNSIPKSPMTSEIQATGRDFAALLVPAKRFRDAARVNSEILGQDFAVGDIRNPGFELPLKLQNTDIFDWQLTPGSQSQIAPTNGEKHGGNNSLAIIFNSAGPGGLPQIGQTVAVEPGRIYEFEAFYRSTLKTLATIRLSIVDAVSQKLLAQTEPAALRPDWTAWTTRFTTPTETDGIVIRLLIDDCAGGCGVSGNLWIDDLKLTPVR